MPEPPQLLGVYSISKYTPSPFSKSWQVAYRTGSPQSIATEENQEMENTEIPVETEEVATAEPSPTTEPIQTAEPTPTVEPTHIV